ncbi:MAG: CHASE2 domain-containing protein [Cytophagales bacterium]|nr:CHASE2 domain-containing protein [Bernardetiaceae bacterium]MDW8204977.1 CHASE2 domain-containing protein [Cytophagales bacterium]
MYKIFNWFNIGGTVFIFLVIGLLQQVAISLDFLNIFEEVIKSYSVTDLAFSDLREPPEADTTIVIVNIGTLTREGIAEQLAIINRYQPRVVGIDVEFSKPKEERVDSLLEAVFAQTRNLVLWSKVEGGKRQPDGTIVWDTLRKVLPRFARHARTGYTNALTEGDSQFESWRETTALEKIADGTVEYSFATQIAMLYDSVKAQKFINRGNEYEIINYRGNTDKFQTLDVNDVFEENFTPETIRDKIVIMCYMGGEYTSTTWDTDKYYTPLNSKQIGRNPPDMYGGVAHANIVSMILHENYIDEAPSWLAYVLAVVLCWLNVAAFAAINQHAFWGLWYDLVSKIIQLIEVVLLVYILLVVFINYSFKLDFTATIAVVLLSGDIFEIYEALVGNIFAALKGSHK